MSLAMHFVQSARGGKNTWPHERHAVPMSLPSRRVSANHSTFVAGVKFTLPKIRNVIDLPPVHVDEAVLPDAADVVRQPGLRAPHLPLPPPPPPPPRSRSPPPPPRAPPPPRGGCPLAFRPPSTFTGTVPPIFDCPSS